MGFYLYFVWKWDLYCWVSQLERQGVGLHAQVSCPILLYFYVTCLLFLVIKGFSCVHFHFYSKPSSPLNFSAFVGAFSISHLHFGNKSWIIYFIGTSNWERRNSFWLHWHGLVRFFLQRDFLLSILFQSTFYHPRGFAGFLSLSHSQAVFFVIHLLLSSSAFLLILSSYFSKIVTCLFFFFFHFIYLFIFIFRISLLLAFHHLLVLVILFLMFFYFWFICSWLRLFRFYCIFTLFHFYFILLLRYYFILISILFHLF